MHTLAKFIFFKLLGWKLVGTFPKIDKCVVIVAPHTSNLDFFLGLLARRVLNEQFNFVAKSSLFKWPFGWYFRKVGGMPVDRSTNNNFVDACADLIQRSKKIHLTLAPEGTRKKVEKWKTGFYYIAKEAKVPLVLVAFDYGNKQVKVSDLHWPSDEIENDFEVYRNFYAGTKGIIKENFTTPSL
ncbi:MAG: lysophospholipid acyltransferase family protein [Aurantibacter sp.]